MSVDEQVKLNTDNIQSIRHFLFGNGEPGWDEMLRKVYDWMQAQQNLDFSKKVDELYKWMLEEKKQREIEEKERTDEKKFIKRAILASILTSVVTLLFSGIVFTFTWFFKLLPILDALQKQVGGQ